MTLNSRLWLSWCLNLSLRCGHCNNIDTLTSNVTWSRRLIILSSCLHPVKLINNADNANSVTTPIAACLVGVMKSNRNIAHLCRFIQKCLRNPFQFFVCLTYYVLDTAPCHVHVRRPAGQGFLLSAGLPSSKVQHRYTKLLSN